MEINDQELMAYFKKSDAERQATIEALQNVYGLMQKQENRYAEEEAARKKKEEEEKLEKSQQMEAARWDSVTKSVTEAVIKTLQGMDVNGKDAHNVNGGDVKIPQNDRWPASKRTTQEDVEVPAKLRTETSEVQKPIQAMHNGTPHGTADEAVEHHVSEQHAPPVEKAEDIMPEYPMEEKDGSVPMDMNALLEKLSVMIDEKLANIQKSADLNVKKSVETIMKKAGWGEEKGLISPKNVSLGAPTFDNKPITPIKKSEDATSTTPVGEPNINELAKNTSFRELGEIFVMTHPELAGAKR